MRKISIGEKLTFGNLLYVIPIIVLTYSLYSARTNDIVFAEQEIVGNTAQKPMEKVLEALALNRIASQRALNGEKVDLSGPQKNVDESLSSLEKTLSIFGEQLKFTPEEMRSRQAEAFSMDTLKKKWGVLRSKGTSLKAAESNDVHADLIAAVRGMISYAGNSSNLILDPDLDTYYLTDTTLAGLPALQDRLQDLIIFAEPILRSGKVSMEDRMKLGVFSHLLKADVERITGDLQTALNEDVNFNGKSETFQVSAPVLMKSISENVSEVGRLVNLLSNGSPVNTEEFLKVTQTALSHSFRSWEVAEPEDTILLKKRIDALKTTRIRYVLLSALVLFAAGFASFLVGRSLRNGMMGAMKDLSGSAMQTRQTSELILLSAEKLSSTSTEQASALQETVSALTEINAMVTKSSENAAHSVRVVAESHDSAMRGRKSVENMVVAIGEISESNELILRQTEESNRKIEDIVRVINEIGNKTKVINDIVFQTKLLSFNASVEAARAGEHGKGFAVVAEEVGKLAEMSGNAAKEISDLLESSTQTVMTIVAETKSRIEGLVKDAKVKVDDGKETAHLCGEMLSSIVTSVDKVTGLVNEIATAASEQAKGVEEITQAMQQLDDVTQTNAKMSTEANNHASDLATQAGTLTQVVKRLHEEVMGGGDSSLQNVENHPTA